MSAFGCFRSRARISRGEYYFARLRLEDIVITAITCMPVWQKEPRKHNHFNASANHVLILRGFWIAPHSIRLPIRPLGRQHACYGILVGQSWASPPHGGPLLPHIAMAMMRFRQGTLQGTPWPPLGRTSGPRRGAFRLPEGACERRSTEGAPSVTVPIYVDRILYARAAFAKGPSLVLLQ
jgi:hypothetical protein